MAPSGSPAADDWRLCHVGVTQNGLSPRPYRWAAWDAHGRKTTALCRSSGRLEHTDRQAEGAQMIKVDRGGRF